VVKPARISKIPPFVGFSLPSFLRGS
jgi:hypothetical protein